MVFDSGIGGTTVLEQIQQLIPNADYSYFMDNALLPYGAQGRRKRSFTAYWLYFAL